MNKKKDNIPFFKPHISKDDKKIIMNSLDKNTLTDGQITKEFEKKYAKYTKSKYAIAVSNATAGLHLSLMSLGIK